MARLAAPIVRLFDGAWRRMHWWVGASVKRILEVPISALSPVIVGDDPMSDSSVARADSTHAPAIAGQALLGRSSELVG